MLGDMDIYVKLRKGGRRDGMGSGREYGKENGLERKGEAIPLTSNYKTAYLFGKK